MPSQSLSVEPEDIAASSRTWAWQYWSWMRTDLQQGDFKASRIPSGETRTVVPVGDALSRSIPMEFDFAPTSP